MPMSRHPDAPIDVQLFARPDGSPIAASQWTAEGLRRAIDTLLRIPFFAAMSAEQLARLATAISTRHCVRGDLLIEQDGHDAALFVLVRGRAHLVRVADNGREVILDILHPGSHAGEMCLIDNQPHSGSVRCLEACTWLRVESGPLARCLGSDPRLSYTLMHALVQRLRRAHRQITALALLDVPERVLHCLIEFSEVQANGQRQVRERLKRQDLARLTGASREMISRVLQRLEANGLIETLPDGSLLLHTSGDPQQPH